mgnify:CR=1 FL=1
MKVIVMAAVVAAGIAGAAQAITVTNVNVSGAGTDVFVAGSTTLPVGAVWGLAPASVTGSIFNQYRSPFEGGAGENTAPYFNLAGGTSATLNFSGIRTVLSFLWGSVDTYNSIAFFLGANPVDTVTSADLTNPNLTFGAEFVTVSGLSFDSVVFSSTSNSLEFAAIQSPAPIPLPAAGGLLLAAIGLLAAARRRATAA